MSKNSDLSHPNDLTVKQENPECGAILFFGFLAVICALLWLREELNKPAYEYPKPTITWTEK